MPTYCTCSKPACVALRHSAGQKCTAQVRTAGQTCRLCSQQLWNEDAESAVDQHPIASSFLSRCAAQTQEIGPAHQTGPILPITNQQQQPNSIKADGDGHKFGVCNDAARHELTPFNRPLKRSFQSVTQDCNRDIQLIHHLWINVGPVDEDPAISMELQLGALGLRRLRTWQPCRQWFWVYYMSKSEREWLETKVVGLQVKFLETHHLHPNSVAALIACGAPLQFIKDILSLKLLHTYGGIYSDLDVIWLGVPFPISEAGYMFGLEPPPRPANAFMGIKKERLTLSILAAPKASTPIHAVYLKIFTHWQKFALDVFLGKKKALVIGSGWHKDWMWNTNTMTEAVKNDPILLAAVQRPVTLRPFPMKFNTTSMAEAFDRTEVDDTVLNEAVDLEKPYICPSMATVAKYSVAIDTWQRQWDKDVQETILAWAEGNAASTPAVTAAVTSVANHSNEYTEFQSQVQGEIVKCLPLIQQFYLVGDAYALMGCALRLLERDWSPRVFMQYKRLWPEGRPPAEQGLLSMLPRKATPITPDIWARVLLLWGLALAAGPSSEKTELLQSCLYRSKLESGTLPLETVKAALRMFSTLYPQVELPG